MPRSTLEEDHLLFEPGKDDQRHHHGKANDEKGEDHHHGTVGKLKCRMYLID